VVVWENRISQKYRTEVERQWWCGRTEYPKNIVLKYSGSGGVGEQNIPKISYRSIAATVVWENRISQKYRIEV
jgi:hypothetical protein